MNNTKVTITGIGGFIGLRFAERALQKGWQVRGLEVSSSAASQATSLGAQVIIGSTTDPSKVREAVGDSEIVFHTAAIVAEHGRWEDFDQVNNQGTRTVCTVARDLGAKRLIHLSSIVVYGFKYSDGVTEAGPLAENEENYYVKTKVSSEKIALEFNDKNGGLEVIVIRPGDVYGLRSAPWILRPLESLKQNLFMLPDGGKGELNLVHVDNLIDGIMLAIEKGQPGEAYNITDGVATTCKEYFGRIGRWVGRKTIISMPGFALKSLIKASGPILKATGKNLAVQPEGVVFLQRRGRYSIEKAQQELGYVPKIEANDGMRDIAKQLGFELQDFSFDPVVDIPWWMWFVVGLVSFVGLYLFWTCLWWSTSNY
eukprot:TRINITY_DN4445_c0_g2_i1.p1 TRINITY_DN4445_c0_g2~~TRINITY_DN4445_c0_g2_i1.p1  ORF type:complete len:378 (-),score=50.29 TRINITY_DN4445_c0_g2_i1:47-1156(-)